MTDIKHSVIINRPADEIWKFMSTVEDIPTWDIGVLDARLTSGGLLGVGATIETRRQFFGRKRVGKVQITEWQPPRMAAFQMKLEQATATQSYLIEPLENGTRLTVTAELIFNGWWKWVAPLMARMLKRDESGDLANIKRILENMSAERAS